MPASYMFLLGAAAISLLGGIIAMFMAAEAAFSPFLIGVALQGFLGAVLFGGFATVVRLLDLIARKVGR